MSIEQSSTETDAREVTDAAVRNTRELVFKRYGRLNYVHLSKEIAKHTGRQISPQMVSNVINHQRGSNWVREAIATIIGVEKERLFLGSKLPSVENNDTAAQ